MKLYTLLLLGLMVLPSCTKYAELAIEGDRVIVKPVDWGIDSIRNVEWSVGTRFRDTISKGILIVVKLPKIDEEKLSALAQKKNVDGWIIKVIRRNPNAHETLGYLYVPFPKLDQRSGASGQIEQAFFQVNYQAAAVSERFSRLSCPAFGHRKYLKNMQIEDDYRNSSKLLSISVSEEEVIMGKVEPFSFSMRIFSGGLSLAGIYEVQLAFYNFQSRTRKSNFLSAPELVNVILEEERLVEGCGVGNSSDPPPLDETKPSKPFKFGN
ncbi:MAG: hypothetical protein A2X86_07625 [Bdellovibrionales bacterium GWA2_49_15]|nr:MAG: hypothetical protein A2X86_07625 [Bdellovibrionales bacterium GWA2_49_15]HAZ11852.1 hypothetical protein [Bdellovibrionales bacterium]